MNENKVPSERQKIDTVKNKIKNELETLFDYGFDVFIDNVNLLYKRDNKIKISIKAKAIKHPNCCNMKIQITRK